MTPILHRAAVVLSFASVLAVASTALAVEADLDGTSSTGALDLRRDLTDAVETFDDRLVRVTDSLPGFGGLFFDDRGDLNVYLKLPARAAGVDPDRFRPAVARALASHFDAAAFTTGAEDAPTAEETLARLRVRPAAYSVVELAAWRERANTLLGEGLAVLTDLAEEANRVRVGVVDAAGIPRAQARLTSLGIPPQAVLVEEVERSVLAATLQGDLEPKAGGLQVITGTKGVCTHGFNAIRRRLPGFVVNSHCTAKPFQHDGGTFAQLPGPVNVVGIETIDPPLFPCTLGQIPFQCRLSDSAFVRYVSGAWPTKGFQLGDIARPEKRVFGGAAGPIEIDARNPFYRVTGTFPAYFVGSALDKVGRTTGHTAGLVHRTCVDELVAPGSGVWVMRCQGEVKFAGVGNGDSGAPVFRWHASGNVTLAGILWGSIPQGFRFSYFDFVQVELGPLQVF